MKKLIIARRCSQIFFLGLFIYVLWSTTYPLESSVSPQVLFKINPLVMFLTSLSQRILLPGIIFSVLMVMLTFIFGRFFCGWVCPFGTLIDGVGCMNKDRRVLPDYENAKNARVKFVILFLVVVFALFGVQVAWVMDPLVIFARFISLNVVPTVTLGVDHFFRFFIKAFDLYGPFYDFYRGLKASFLGVQVYYFSNSLATFFLCAMVVGSSLILRRLWCRGLCPLGALYALIAKFSLLERKTEKCMQCGKCQKSCRMGAIKDDMSYRKEECVLCMDCVYDCPQQLTRFGWPKSKEGHLAKDFGNRGVSRRDFLFLMVTSFFAMGFAGKGKGVKNRGGVIRPPGVEDEGAFLNKCVRCGNCMKVCPTNGLQPVMLESGWQGIWTPQLVPEIGYCEYNCTLCSEVCPTGAIPQLPLKDKQKEKMGLAKVNHSICLAWAHNTNCLVCEEHCPVSQKAIKVSETMFNGERILRPVVEPHLCIGCGICQNKCPVRPERAIRVKT